MDFWQVSAGAGASGSAGFSGLNLARVGLICSDTMGMLH
jgi:hypothetical protein